RYTGLPARLAGYGTTWHGDDCVLWAEAEIAQMAVFGEQLVLTRRIEADLGGTSLRISDTVTNAGPTACPPMMRYHFNIRFPLPPDDPPPLQHRLPGGSARPRAQLPRPDCPLRQRGEPETLPHAARARARLRRAVL